MAKRPFVNPEGEASANAQASRTLIERAYEQLRADIIAGRLPPGEKLRVEHLKDSYGVGAGTLREAITRLVSDMLVLAEGQRGFRVAPMAIEDLQDLTRLRLHIEIDALRQSIRNATPEWRLKLQLVYEELSAIEQPVRAELAPHWEALNQRFHEVLISGCGSPWTFKVLRQLSRHCERYRSLAMGLVDSGRDVHAEHQQIYEYAMAGHEARAALALEAHICATPDLLARHGLGLAGALFASPGAAVGSGTR